jgi:nitroreductase
MTLKKPADADHPIHDLIRNRWSPRAIAGKPVAKKTLLTVLEAARWAASSNNGQPWAFILATKDDAAEHQRLVECLMPGNQGWAKNAPVLMLTFARTKWEGEDRLNRTAQHDLGLAAATLTLQAETEGLVVHQMAGIDVGKIRETYGVPEVYEPVSAIAIGYQGEVDDLDSETFREREVTPRVRKALPEFVFSGKFGASSPLVS